MAGLTAGERAAAALLERREQTAARVTAALYAQDDTLLERFGEAGRARCQEDMRYNLEHLAPAVALEEASMFTGYVCWLLELLSSFGVPASDVRRSLELMRTVLLEDLQGDEAAAVTVVLDEGLAIVPAR